MSAGTLDQARTAAPRRPSTGEDADGWHADRRDGGRGPAPAARRSAPQRSATRGGSTTRRSTPRRTADPWSTRSNDAQRAGGVAPFVLLIMVLLTSGLVATLWLSTAAAADSYRLNSARQVARDLSEQTERLHRQVEAEQSAPAIAAAATALGMVPAGEPAVLLVAPDGSTRVIGTPRAAHGAPPPAPVTPTPRAASDPEVVAQTGADGGPSPAATSPAPAGPAGTPLGATGTDDQLTAVGTSR